MPEKPRRLSAEGEHHGLASEAYLTVRERILHGELGIGEVISRRKLAAELGMSFLPVSEALLRLEYEGLLESRPRAGTRVRLPTRAGVQGHYVVREALESQAAILFTREATSEERAELLKLARSVDACSAQPGCDRRAYLDLHEKLHRRIAECARCAALSNLIDQTAALASTWLCATPRLPAGNPPSHHENLLKVLSGDDPALSAEAMREHIRLSYRNAMRRLEPFFESQKKQPRRFPRRSGKVFGLEPLGRIYGSRDSAAL